MSHHHGMPQAGHSVEHCTASASAALPGKELPSVNRNEGDETSPPAFVVDSPNGSPSQPQRATVHLDGALYRILEYLTPREFYVLGACLGSRSWKRFLLENPHTDYLFASKSTTTNNSDTIPSAGHGHKHHHHHHHHRRRLQNFDAFRKSVKGLTRPDRPGKRRKRLRTQQASFPFDAPPSLLNRVGVFPAAEEDAIVTNNSNGYFGILLVRPGVLAVWGDYSGFFLTSHADRLLRQAKPSTPAEAIPADLRKSISEEKEEIDDPFDCRGKGAMAESRFASKLNEETTVSASEASRGGEGYLFPECYQVMAVLCCQPYIFLGFANGVIHSIDSQHPMYCREEEEPAVSDPEGQTTSPPPENGRKKANGALAVADSTGIEYPHVSESRHHFGNEIASLCGVEGRHLVSGAMHRGTFAVDATELRVHWNALTCGSLRAVSRIRLGTREFGTPRTVLSTDPRGGNQRPTGLHRVWDVSPLAMASTTTEDGRTHLSIGTRGQNLAHLTLWDKSCEPAGADPEHAHCRLQGNPSSPASVIEPLSCSNANLDATLSWYRGFRKSVKRSEHFVCLRYFETTKLVAGTSKGYLVKLDLAEDLSLWDRRTRLFAIYAGQRSRSSPCFAFQGCDGGGMVEAVELVGDPSSSNGRDPILVVAGSGNGTISFYNWTTLGFLGSLGIHPGCPRRPPTACAPQRRVYSPVVSVWFCHERSSLVSFCRDGHLHEWKVRETAARLDRMRDNGDDDQKGPSKAATAELPTTPERSKRARRTTRAPNLLNL